MYSKYILLFFFQSILCLYIPENYSEYFKNATSNVPNVTEIEEKVKAYEKDFLLLYKKAIKPRAISLIHDIILIIWLIGPFIVSKKGENISPNTYGPISIPVII